MISFAVDFFGDGCDGDMDLWIEFFFEFLGCEFTGSTSCVETDCEACENGYIEGVVCMYMWFYFSNELNSDW